MPKIFKKSVFKFVQSQWGKEDEDTDMVFEDMEEFFVDMLKKRDWILDDQTWNDMDMNRVFRKVNRTFSSSGQQVLYNTLRTLQFDEAELKRRDRLIDFFQHNKDEREKLSCVFYFLGKEGYDGAASILFKGMPSLPDYASWAPVLTVCMILSILSVFLIGVRALIPILIMFIVNTVFHNKLNAHTEATMPAIKYIGKMIYAAKVIEQLGYPQLQKDYNEFFGKCAVKCATILKKARSVGLGGGDPFGLSEYAKMLFLSEARGFLRALKHVEEDVAVLRVLYRKLGELDAFQSVASYRRGLRIFSKPKFVEAGQYIRAESVGHPLLSNPVYNSITIDHKNIVVTGSNMSGKSTFLRTVAINSVFAQTIYTTVSKQYETSFFNVLTSISPSDDLLEGKSYYMAEAEALLRMVNVLEEDRCSLLIIDEIFRGTNPLERVAAASALLQYFAKRNTLVIVATHDMEITQNVDADYTSYHFSENVTRDSLDFDYKLKEGPLTKPNGIRILEYIGYPEEITERAFANTGYVLNPEDAAETERMELSHDGV